MAAHSQRLCPLQVVPALLQQTLDLQIVLLRRRLVLTGQGIRGTGRFTGLYQLQHRAGLLPATAIRATVLRRVLVRVRGLCRSATVIWKGTDDQL